MTNLDLSLLTNKQLAALAWELRGTPAVEPVYREYGSRPKRVSIAPDDPDWETKFEQGFKAATPNSRRDPRR